MGIRADSPWAATLFPASYFMVEVVLDPDGEAILLGDENGIETIGFIENGSAISPTANDSMVLRPLTITFSNPNEGFDAFGGRAGGQFREVQRILASDVIATAGALTLEDGLLDFQASEVIVLSDGTNSEKVTISSIVGSTVNFSPNLTDGYAAGSVVSSLPVAGQEVSVRLRLNADAANYVEVYRGVAREAFELGSGKATLRLDNMHALLLSAPLRIISTSPTQTKMANFQGQMETALVWDDAASTSLTGITVYAGAFPGEYGIRMDSSTTFTVTGPNIPDIQGSTASDFYDVTDATDSHVKIASADWTSPTAGDTLAFHVAVNFVAKTLPQIIYELLHDYAGIPDSQIDVNLTSSVVDEAEKPPGTVGGTFNVCQALTKNDALTLSFANQMATGTAQITVLEAIMTLLPHGIAFMAQGISGKFRLMVLHPEWAEYVAAELVTPDVIGNPTVRRLQPFNAFMVHYAWDCTDAENKGHDQSNDLQASPAELLGSESMVDYYVPFLRG